MADELQNHPEPSNDGSMVGPGFDAGGLTGVYEHNGPAKVVTEIHPEAPKYRFTNLNHIFGDCDADLNASPCFARYLKKNKITDLKKLDTEALRCQIMGLKPGDFKSPVKDDAFTEDIGDEELVAWASAWNSMTEATRRSEIDSKAHIQALFRYGLCNKQTSWYYSFCRGRGNWVQDSCSDYAGDSTDRKSTHGYVFTLAGGAISWSSRKQETTATSTTKAKYVGLCSAAKTAAWITGWLKEANLMRFLKRKPVQLYGDNQSGIRLIKNPEFHAQTKHIDVQYHYIQEALEDGLIELFYVPTIDMTADCLTKPLTKEKFQTGLSLVGLVDT